MKTFIKNLIIDMDGVLWIGETPIPGLVEFFATLRRLDINFVLATNNATKVAEQYTEKLARFGVEVAPAQILTSAEATASYLGSNYPPGTPVFAIGESGLHQALAARSFTILSIEEVHAGAEVPLVVVGFTRHVTYPELAAGALAVSRGATFVGTNPDVTFPSEFGPLPGAGALQAVISTATGVEPTVIGKPNPIIFQEALRRLGSMPLDAAMVGDRLSTDIAGAKAAGMRTILVLTGITQPEELESSPLQPDYVFDSIAHLAASLEEAALSLERGAAR